MTIRTEISQRVYDAVSTVLYCECSTPYLLVDGYRAHDNHCQAQYVDDVVDQVVQAVGVWLAEEFHKWADYTTLKWRDGDEVPG